jgi:hypothetical protein
MIWIGLVLCCLWGASPDQKCKRLLAATIFGFMVHLSVVLSAPECSVIDIEVAELLKAAKHARTARQKQEPLRVAVATVFIMKNQYSWMAPLSYHNKKQYTLRNGYDLIVGNSKDRPRHRTAHWAKFHLLRKWLPFYDAILYVDADTLFTRFDSRIESFLPQTKVPLAESPVGTSDGPSKSSIPQYYEKQLTVTSDWNGLNSGVLLIRNSTLSQRLIDAVFGVDPKKFRNPEWEDQAALIEVVDNGPEDLRRVVEVRPSRPLNAYPGEMAQGNIDCQWRAGDFIAHVPGCKDIALKDCRAAFEATFAFVQEKYELPPLPSSDAGEAWQSHVNPEIPT